MPEPQRPEFSKKVVSLHRYFSYDHPIVRHRPSTKDLWQGEKMATEDLLISPSSLATDVTKCINLTPIAEQNDHQLKLIKT